MINKFYSIFFIFVLLFVSKNLIAQDLNINAKIIEVEKLNQVIVAEGDVEVIDLKNNIINAQKIKYDKTKQILNTFGETEVFTSEKYYFHLKI